jgi:hypothetical protein
MVTPYTSPTKLTTSLLIHIGNLAVNQVDGGTVPPEFVLTTDSVSVTTSFVGLGVYPDPPPFTHFDASVMQAAGYDELIIDPGPVLTWNTSTLGVNISTLTSYTDYRQAAATNRPFWLLIHLDGYGIAEAYANAEQAMTTALGILQNMYNDMVNLHTLTNFRGFAFLRPDLNVLYTDGSALSRFQQNTLVQTCWNLNVSACFITARPADMLTLIGPTLTTNPNSGIALDNPIIGCNVASTDKIVIIYPNIEDAGQNISVVIGQVSATLTSTNRDPGFAPQIDFAYVVPMSDAFWTADGTGGVTGVGSIETQLANISNFCAAMGVTGFGLYGVTSVPLDITGYNFPSPIVFLPPDANVNVTNSSQVWGRDGNVFVAYANTPGATVPTVVRQFSPQFVETAYVGPPYP